MRTLSAATAAAVGSPAVTPLLLMAIEFTAPAAFTLRVSDRLRVELGEEWLPLVADWGTLEDVLNGVDAGGAPATAEVTLFNRKPVAGRSRLSDLIRSPQNTGTAYEWAFAKVTVYRLDDGLGSGDEVPLGVFYLEEPTAIDEDLLRLRMSDLTLVLEDQLPLTRITRDRFPAAAADVIGQMLRRPFGRLTGVPLQPIVDGAYGTLAAAITAAATTLTLEDADDFDPSGTLQIRAEQMTYTRAGTVFTVTRGANATTAIEHPAGTPVVQLRPLYRFAVGEVDSRYPLQAVTNIQVDGQAARTAPVVSEEVLGGTRVAVVTFTPADVKTFHGLASGEPWSISVATLTVTVDGAQFLYVTRTVPIPSGAEIGPRTIRAMTFIVNSPTGHGLTGMRVYRRLVTGAGGTGTTGTGVLIAEMGSQAAGWSYNGSDTRTYDSTADEVIELGGHIGGAGGVGQVALTFISYTVAADVGSGRSTAGRLIGAVTCDVDGVQDDAAGTITGTPRALLENPADVARYLVSLYPGISVGDFGDSWAVARARLDGYRWAVLLGVDGPMTFSELRKLIGEQARATLALDVGVWHLRYIPDAPAADLVLDYDRNVWSDVPAQVSRTQRTRIFNRVVASAQRDYVNGGYQLTHTAEDLTQPGLEDPLETALELPFVQDAATAAALATFWLGQWKRLRWQVELVAWQNALALEKGDHIAFVNHPVLEAHGGAALVFRVTGKRYLLDADNPARIQLSAIEANP